MNKKSWLRSALVLPLFLLAGVPAAADTPPPMSANVIMTDAGFNPASVTIQPGGSVTWINQGQNVHNAASLGGAPLPFNTPGLGPGASTSLSFGVPGQYWYTSAPDCVSGSVMGFPCAISFLVNVTSPSVMATSAAATAAAVPPTPTPTATPIPANLPQPIQNVYIDDTGISPPSVTIALYGQVLFTNQGFNVHSATAQGNSTWQGFDTGGLSRGQVAYIGFSQPGTFQYTSAPDCLNGNLNPDYKCGPYTIVVSSQALPSGPTTVPTAAPTAIPALAAPNPNTQVVLDDTGFHPNVLNIKAGQTVTWIAQGTQVHTVTSDASYVPAFDSGGMNPGQTFSVTFSSPGSFGYHSQTDATYFTDAGCGCTAANYLMRGTVAVSP